MKKYLMLPVLLVFAVQVWSQSPANPVITSEAMQKHIYYLASEECQGRESGMLGQKLAAAYIANEFKKSGLTSLSTPADAGEYFQRLYLYGRAHGIVKISHHESTEDSESQKKTPRLSNNDKFLYYGDSRNESTSSKTLRYISDSIDFGVISKIDTSMALVFTAEDILSGIRSLVQTYFTTGHKTFFMALDDHDFAECYEGYGDDQLLELRNQDTTQYYSYGFNIGNKVSAGWTLNEINKTILSMVKEYKDLQLFIVSDSFLKKIYNMDANQLALQAEVSDEVVDILYDFELDIASSPTENVIGYIEGSTLKDEVIVIGAHYDHVGVTTDGICYGADDNASGTAAVMEIARCFGEMKRAGITPQRSILFIAFTGEEKGLYGSEYYVQRPVIPLSSTKLILNMDMIGRFLKDGSQKKHYVYMMTTGALKKPIKRSARKVNRKNHLLKLDLTPGVIQRVVFAVGSDHFSFRKHKISTAVFTSGFNHPDYHTPRDTPERINYENVTSIANLVFLTAMELANRKELK